MITIAEIKKEQLNKAEYYDFPNKSLFTTFEWLDYICEDSGAIPFFLRITDGDCLLGYFTGATVRKFGIKIAGSPFSGWSTVYMGFDVVEGVNAIDLLLPVKEFLFKKRGVHFIEIADRSIPVDVAIEAGYNADVSNTLELDINRSDEELFKVFKTDCRNFIRQFERRGAICERAIPNDEFAEEYYMQLIDVFSKQHLVPTYSLQKVKNILKHQQDGETILCLRVRDPETRESIASSIFLAYNNTFYFWGGASYRSGQHYRPNEFMIWTAIRFWREKGYKTFDMVGVRDYKRKFGPQEVQYAHILISKYRILTSLRICAEKAYYKFTAIKGKMLKRK